MKKDHYDSSLAVIRKLTARCVAVDGLGRYVGYDTESVVDYVLRPHAEHINAAHGALKTIIDRARSEAVEGVVNAIRKAEGIDPFVIDDVVERWLREQREVEE